MRFCTIVASNYLPYARVLAESLAIHHPGSELAVLVVDASPGELHEAFRTVTTEELNLSPAEVHRLATIYNVTEFATALKPWLLELMVTGTGEGVAYLDPDIRVYSPLDVVADALVEHGLAFTPHTTRPMPRDGLQPNEQDILLSGTYNLGFVAVDRRALPFLLWWQERLFRDCLHEVGKGLFVDQRWVDLAVHYFPYVSLRDEGCNVAYWNVDSRPIRRTEAGFHLNDVPLRFFHFSGYRPENPSVLSRHHISAARLDPSSTEALRELCMDYSKALSAAGYDAATMGGYGFATSLDGVLLSKRIRRRYRRELLAGAALPDPFSPQDAGTFRHWARRTTSLRDQAAARIPVRARLLAKAADDPQLAWQVLRSKVRAPRVGRRRDATASSAARPGVNVIGYFQAEDGVGHGARVMAACLDAAGVDHTIVVNRQTPSSQNAAFAERVATQTHPVDVVCANADMFPTVLAAHAAKHGRAAYTIGVWAWEVAAFPEQMAKSAALVDEVWTLSHHAAAAIAPVIDKPVLVFPYPVFPTVTQTRPRVELGLPEGFLLLFCFDANSIVARKNPDGLVRAYREAFAEADGAHLVIKAVNGGRASAPMEDLRAAMAGRADVHLLTEQLSPAGQAELMASADCYVSLHRAEGLGLTMAEAMANGTPVIATGYSGNLEFMNVSNAYLVPYTLVPIPAGCEPYPAGALWAEPDVSAAGAQMRSVFENPSAAQEVGLRGKADIDRWMVPIARRDFLHQRLDHVARCLAEQQ